MRRPRYLPADEEFIRHPRRLNAALKPGDLSWHGHGLVRFLVDECELNGGEAVYTITSLIEATRYPKSDDSLRRELARLRADGWIDYDVAERQRAPYVFRLGKAALATVTAADEGDRVRQSGDDEPGAVRQSDDAQTPLGKRASGRLRSKARGSHGGGGPLLSSLLLSEEPSGTRQTSRGRRVPQAAIRIVDECMGCGERTAVQDDGDLVLCDGCRR